MSNIGFPFFNETSGMHPEFLDIMFREAAKLPDEIKEFDFIEHFMGLKDFTHSWNKYNLNLKTINKLRK